MVVGAAADSVERFLAGHPLAGTPDAEAALTESLVAQRLFATQQPAPRVGNVELLRPLGAGGMGRVYLGRDTELGREVAVKFLRAPIVDDGDGQPARRLGREARALARINHPHVVSVYGVGHDATAGLYVVMEYLPGTTLRTWIEARRQDHATRITALLQCAQGLHAAHEAGIVHRDFKPDNVLVGEAGEVKIADFGLARTRAPAPEGVSWSRLESTLTTASLAGTIAYMAPERLDGQAPDIGNDVFAFCMTAWELLASRRPLSSSPPLAELPVSAALGRALLRGLHSDPRQRWPSMLPLCAALTDELAPPRSRIDRVVVIAIAIAIAIALLLGFVLGRGTR